MNLLERFVIESNAIEGILRDPTREELEASARFIDLDVVTVEALQDFVSVCQPGSKLRTGNGMDVIVVNHRPPRGGAHIRPALEDILLDAHAEADPHAVHVDYETLHPFTDGNGRSGRILWAWQMVNQDHYWGLRLGFLQAFYYQTLERSRR